MSSRPALSIVTSMYRSAGFLDAFYTRCTTAATRLVGTSYEIVLVNDGSPDDSLTAAIALSRRDPHVRVLDLSRNFGHHRALMTGLAHARGGLVFLIDCDLEEDPDWLIAFSDTLRASGADAVYGVQEVRKGGPLERLAGGAFFRIFNRLLTHPIPANVTTARLMTHRFVQALVSHEEREVALAGLCVLTGFEQRPHVVRKGSRPGTSYTMRKRISVFVNAITSLSNRPLVYIFQIGVGVMALSLVAGVVLLYESLHGRVGVPGWASVMVSIWFLGGLIIFCVGVIGMYLSKIFLEVKHRPYTIVRAEYGSAPTERIGSGRVEEAVGSERVGSTRGQGPDRLP
jgi:putative glycosyltransferase